MRRPELRITERSRDVPIQGRCSVCDVSFDASEEIGDRYEQERRLNDLFSEHLRQKHAED
jgi:hypothetical protein